MNNTPPRQPVGVIGRFGNGGLDGLHRQRVFEFDGPSARVSRRVGKTLGLVGGIGPESNHPAVGAFATPGHEPQQLQTVEETSDVRVASGQSLANLAARQPFGVGVPERLKDAVLTQCQSERLQDLGKASGENLSHFQDAVEDVAFRRICPVGRSVR